MESSTKSKLDEGRILKLIERNFGSQATVDRITPLDGGMMNAVYLISFGGDVMGWREMILKLSFSRDADVLTYESQIMRAEVEVYRRLEGKGVPIPKLICHDFSQEIVDCDCFFLSRIEGMLWKDCYKESTPGNLAKLKRELGRYNALMHSVKGDYFGYIKEDRAWRFDTWFEAFRFMMDNMMEDGRRRRYDLPYKDIRLTVERHRGILDEVKEPRLVDFDLWAGNVFLRKEGEEYRISGIMDFERAFYGDPYADFIAAFGIYGDIAGEEAFIEGYSEAAGAGLEVTHNDRIRMKLYRIYMDLNLVIETYRFEEAYREQVIKSRKAELQKLLGSL
ncbi:MAG: aminoglycoside phosphotransferase family protein [Lachnospiraceae bacterium]|nr:aminoglycoside phosphotransferase family protein [Lachnospiraceae bacterium]